MISFRRRHVIVKSKWPALAWGRGGQSGNRTRRQAISPQPPILLIIACPTKAILVISRDKIQTNKHIWTFVSDGKTGIEFSDRIKKTTDRGTPAQETGIAFVLSDQPRYAQEMTSSARGGNGTEDDFSR